MESLEGKNLGRYKIKRLIGKGGMADVYQGYDAQNKRRVALKVFKREDEEMLRRFIREARLMEALHHPHLMPIYNTGASKLDGITQYYIVMPLMEGGSLRSQTRQGPLDLGLASRYLREIADALDYIHAQGIIHRDIKSSNVLLDADGRCYLSDFGIARTVSDATRLTSTGNVLGTVDYVAPELFETNRKADAKSDLYSLGVLLFEIVTGHLPFSSDNQIALVAMHINNPPPSPCTYVPDLPGQVERVILRGLEKRPERRYGSAMELAEAFNQAVRTSNGGRQRAGVVSPAGAELERPLVLPGAPVSLPVMRPAPLAGVPAIPLSTPPVPRTPMPQSVPPVRKGSASPTRARMHIVTILALLALLAVLVPVIYVAASQSWKNGPTPTATTIAGNQTASSSPAPNTTATAQAIASATAQAKNATATAIVAPTATFQAQATATAGVIQTATAGPIQYSNSLTDGNNATGWDRNGHCTFKGDGYHVTETTGLGGTGQLRGCRLKQQFTNATFSVEMTMISGNTGGLFFRVNTTSFGAYAGYLFEVDSQGRYRVRSSSNFSLGNDENDLQPWTSSSALHVGNVKNKLEVIANGNGLSFYANDTFLTSLQDARFASGSVALLATTADNGSNADVVYENLNVFQQV